MLGVCSPRCSRSSLARRPLRKTIICRAWSGLARAGSVKSNISLDRLDRNGGSDSQCASCFSWMILARARTSSRV